VKYICHVDGAAFGGHKCDFLGVFSLESRFRFFFWLSSLSLSGTGSGELVAAPGAQVPEYRTWLNTGLDGKGGGEVQGLMERVTI